MEKLKIAITLRSNWRVKNCIIGCCPFLLVCLYVCTDKFILQYGGLLINLLCNPEPEPCPKILHILKLL
ncbi:hypothetical protein SAMN05216357_106193 [Porphyromonadaceae bacterium KH3CP3RA]|nr:hypothetical protein SAMN05216357_106193 [Porphyromonadaceae bacterium KH3CP3RA]